MYITVHQHSLEKDIKEYKREHSVYGLAQIHQTTDMDIPIDHIYYIEHPDFKKLNLWMSQYAGTPVEELGITPTEPYIPTTIDVYNNRNTTAIRKILALYEGKDKPSASFGVCSTILNTYFALKRQQPMPLYAGCLVCRLLPTTAEYQLLFVLDLTELFQRFNEYYFRETIKDYICLIGMLNQQIAECSEFREAYQDRLLNVILADGNAFFLPRTLIEFSIGGGRVKTEKEKRREEELRQRALHIRDEINALQRDNSINILSEILGKDIVHYLLPDTQHIEPSPLVIDSSAHIFISAFNNLEIKMTPLAKAVYILFLRHEEGILLKDIPNYHDELWSIYSHISNRSDMDAIRQSVADLTISGSELLNQQICRIAAAFRKNLATEIAEHYYIRGKRNEVKYISLPRKLVDIQITL